MEIEENNTQDTTQFAKTLDWLQKNMGNFPPDIFECLTGGLNILQGLDKNGKLPKKNIGLQIEFLKKMGIISSSEKFSSIKKAEIEGNSESSNQDEITKKLNHKLKIIQNELNISKKNARKLFTKMTKLKNKKRNLEGELVEFKLARETIKELVLQEGNFLKNLDHSEQEGEEKEELSDEELKQENEPQFEPISEKMFEEPAVFARETEIFCNLEDEIKNSIEGKTKTFYSERIKFHVDFSVVKQKYLVEQVYSFTPENLFTAKVPQVGPRGSRITYDSIAFIILMISCYYVPINRLSKMLSSHGKSAFGSSSICRYLKYFADCALPIYFELFDQISETKVLNCDDTTTKTIETKKRIENQKNDIKQSAEKIKPDLKSSLNLDKKSNLFKQTEEKLGFESKLKNSEDLKKQLNVSCLIGKSVEKDHKSYIVFYRTHLGSSGNLIEKILEIRKPENELLKLQSDLSDTNYPQKFTEKFTVEKFGCLPHARRAFFKYRSLDPELCTQVLLEFKQIAIYEKILAEMGLTEEYIFAHRFAQARPCLEKILASSKQILEKWAPKSELGKAANYVVENYELLIKYIDHPDVQSSNNVSERALRGEKLMLNSSKFRKTENGRVIYDICRTLVATCNAAQIPLKEYFVYIMKNKAHVEANPQNYTPYAYSEKFPTQKIPKKN